ncbi:hypothetical protein ACIGQE_15310 [Streptomyces sp. NPDC053429]|uniref:hypothetical protein n=1 Tax=Streptomyces sp. NPDC053429 TaxID=3365702 RepID=UPI0037D275B7
MSARPVKTLYDPQAPDWTPPLDIALTVAREMLAQHQRADISDDRAMLSAAVCLEIALRHLLAAYDAEVGR